MITGDAVSAPLLPRHRRVTLLTRRNLDFAGALGKRGREGTRRSSYG